MERSVKVLLKAIAKPFPDSVRVYGNILDNTGIATSHGVEWPANHWDDLRDRLIMSPLLKANAEHLLPSGAEVALGIHSMTLDLPAEAFPEDQR